MTDVSRGTLADFLLARIAEDEAAARLAIVGETTSYTGAPLAGGTGQWSIELSAADPDYGHGADVELMDGGWCVAVTHGTGADPDPAVLAHAARHNPARVLAECEAKRRIIEASLATAMRIDGEWGDGCSVEEIRDELCGDHGEEHARLLLGLLAVPYADHPHFRPEWRP